MHRVAQDHGLSRPGDVLHDGQGELGAGLDRDRGAHLDQVRVDRDGRLDDQSVLAFEHQDALLRTGVLDDDVHQPLHHVLEDDLAGDGLRRANDRLDVEQVGVQLRGRGGLAAHHADGCPQVARRRQRHGLR